MKLLLDTHALLWWLHEPEKLPPPVMELIADGENIVMASVVSAMEIATKTRLGKLGYATPLATRFGEEIAVHGFIELAIGAAHAQRAGSYPAEHRDPWDRLLAAQSDVERAALVTRDSQIADFGVKTIW